MAANMPRAEVTVTGALVEDLITDQRPDLKGLSVSPIAFGWDNFSFRVGDRFVARLPRRREAVPLVQNEARWLPELESELPLPIPTPRFVGRPGHGYPWPWTLVPWIPGGPVALDNALDREAAANVLARFLRALHQPAPEAAPENPYRGIPLAGRDAATRERVESLVLAVDTAAVLDLWERALAIHPHDGAPLWIHGDLHPANVLSVRGRLSGVIDFGDITSGDPATDLSIAWMLFPRAERSIFHDIYGRSDESTWARARGWALSLAIAYLANSADNETMRTIGTVTLARVLDES